jgi:hypothetical protein
MDIGTADLAVVFRLVPPAMKQSQKLIRLPRVTKGNRMVCFNPTVWAMLACSSKMVPARTWAPLPASAPSRKYGIFEIAALQFYMGADVAVVHGNGRFKSQFSAVTDQGVAAEQFASGVDGRLF